MSKSIFIIGMGPGIGAATAERFASEGWAVVLGSRNPQKLERYVAALKGKGANAHAVHVDAVNAAEVRTAMASAERLTGGLSAVHYNAAFVREQDLFSMTDTEVESDLAVNISGGLHTIRAAHELFSSRGGIILITGGGLSVAPHASFATLGLGKAALRNLVKGLAPELAVQGIRIAIATVGTSVAPGSREAQGAADTLWKLATASPGQWEAVYPGSGLENREADQSV